jgi:hypothetical protein
MRRAEQYAILVKTPGDLQKLANSAEKPIAAGLNTQPEMSSEQTGGLREPDEE